MAQRNCDSSGEVAGDKKQSTVGGAQSDFSVTSRLLPGPNQLRPQGVKQEHTLQYLPSPEHSATLAAPPPSYALQQSSSLPTASPGLRANSPTISQTFAAVPVSSRRNSTPKQGSPSDKNTRKDHSTVGCQHDEEGDWEEDEEEDSGEDSDGEFSCYSSRGGGSGGSVEEPKKPKRTRTAYSNYQLDQLELVFAQTQYPDVFLREEMASRLGIKEDRIQVWFQNRRARFRKQERTGCVSLRSRYRQRRLQKAIKDSHGATSMFPGYSHSAPPAPLMLPPPQAMHPFMPNFPMSAGTQVTSSSPNSNLLPPNSTPLPGFHTLRPQKLPGPDGAAYFPTFYTSTGCGHKP